MNDEKRKNMNDDDIPLSFKIDGVETFVFKTSTDDLTDFVKLADEFSREENVLVEIDLIPAQVERHVRVVEKNVTIDAFGTVDELKTLLEWFRSHRQELFDKLEKP